MSRPAPAPASSPSLPALGLVLLAAAGTFGLTMGTRQSMGLFLGDINTATGLGFAAISLAFAVGQLGWGLTQPFAGWVADRYGAGRVLVCGVLLVAAGMALIPLMHGLPGQILAIGVLASGGAGMAGPSVLIAATARLVPAERRGMANGLIYAGGSLGQFVFAPLAQALKASLGWAAALQVLGAAVLLSLPAAAVLRARRPAAAPTGSAGATRPAGSEADARAAGDSRLAGGSRPADAAPAAASGGAGVPAASSGATAPQPTAQVLRTAFADRSYRLLAAGFFVCGFHIGFMMTHLPGVVASCGLAPAVAGWSLALIGLFNMAGSFAMGWAVGFRGGIWRMKSLLSGVYAARALAILVFLAAPKTPLTMLVFAAVMGFTFLSTVPPTAGLVAKFFGPANLGMLFGVLMVSHQVGGFLGAWLGGKAFEHTGHYDSLWLLDAALAAAAALVHLPIREPRGMRLAPA